MLVTVSAYGNQCIFDFAKSTLHVLLIRKQCLFGTRLLDPLFPLMFANSAVVALQAGEPKEAIEFATQAIAINPEFWVGYLHLGNARLALGDYDAAIDAFSDAEKFSGGNNSRAAAARAYALAKLGRTDEARDVLVELISRSAQRHVAAYNIAVVHAGLGEVDSAFEWLERAMAVHDISCFSLAKDLTLESLRMDLRFECLMKRCGTASQPDSLN